MNGYGYGIKAEKTNFFDRLEEEEARRSLDRPLKLWEKVALAILVPVVGFLALVFIAVLFGVEQ